MDRRTSVGRGALTVLGGLLIFVLALGALAGCGSSGNEGNNNVPSNTPNNSVPGNAPNPTTQPAVTQPPAGGATEAGGTITPGETTSGSNVVVRVSGAQGTAFSGTYGTAQDVRVADGTVGTDPTDYPVTGASDVVTATFKKTEPGTDLLEVSILDGGEVVTRSQTYADLGSVTVNWSPREETQGADTTLPGGAGSDRSLP